MFLVTTGDQRFWKKDQRILFLGEWCKLYDQKEQWSKLDFEVLPYHWDDRAQLYKDYQYLGEVNERYLLLLAERLNELHRVDRSLRYWRILIGYWLIHFIPILYDRYRSICDAARSRKVSNTWIAATSPGQQTPRDFAQFVELFVSDEYNQYLYSYIIRSCGRIPFEEVDVQLPCAPVDHNAQSKRDLLRPVKRIIRAYARNLPYRRNKVVFIDSCFDLRNLIRLEVNLRQWPSLIQPTIDPLHEKPDQSLRSGLTVAGARNQFESLLDKILPDQLPVAYAEGYREMHQRSLCGFPQNPERILTATGYATNEAFKFWAAHHVERNVKLEVMQHGGHYGSGLWSGTENHEICISDRFYTWGWRLAGEQKTVPLPGANLVKFHRRRLTHQAEGDLLWVHTSLPRYSYFMFSSPAGPQVANYLRDQQNFFEALEPQVRDLLLLRLYPSDYGWRESSRWRDFAPGLRQSPAGESLQSQINRSRLVISTNNATTFLETLSANFPTVIFWNPEHWELRPAAQPFFDKLREAGIFHDTPEAAAEKVNAVHKDVLGWWRMPAVQTAREQFCWQFARSVRGWRRQWKQALRSPAD